MKYLVIGTFANNGNPYTKMRLCNGLQEKKDFLHSIIFDEATQKYYKPTVTTEDAQGDVWQGEYAGGKWAVKTIRFTANQQLMSKTYDASVQE